ncbi:YARHG domain-containing protein [Sebaldella sp. S0638]|uniref:YARHG domain-containing protein n=1 Tax=Sebaldella sp. S0638 TaxID=2957809 RepID=UPI00209FDD7D|nr:YARHG domain-containing protein [Sebaldella sp. S0638]MCP1223151.1 YARHG domain-containing protein [Sebaldella sp. S0638]
MKKVIFLILTAFCCIVFSNDWEFGSEGEHLIPLEMSDSSIKSEKIVMKLTEKGMEINVKFVFESPKDEMKKIGFITPPDEQQGQLSMSDFKTKVNGKEVISMVEEFDKSPFKTNSILKKEAEKMSESSEHSVNGYVYYFDAQFKKGGNIVEHSYIYSGSGGVDGKDYEYVITTISKWKNKRVEDFELVIDMGNNSLFMLPYTFWKDNKKINWEIVGEGRMTDLNLSYRYEEYDMNVLVKVKNGYVRYKTKNFSPDFDINIHEGSFHNGFLDFLPGSKQGKYIYKDELTYIYGRYTDEIYQLSDEDIRIIRNYPYAVAGYDFSDSALKKYFSQFFWYDSISKNVNVSKEEAEYYKEKTEAITAVRKEIKEYLSENLSKYSKDEQRKIRNIPYALRGYDFKDKDLQNYFKKKYSWYKADKYVTLSDIVLTADEKELINKLDKISNSN